MPLFFLQGAYIAAQGPVPATVNDFVRMIWEQECKVIIMVCKEFENGKVCVCEGTDFAFKVRIEKNS